MRNKYLLVYGSLKKNSYNFNRFGANSQTFIENVILNGYKMYNLGAYPAIVKSGAGKIYCELHEIEEKTYDQIYFMEIGAGYLEKKVDIGNITASIFVMEKENIKHCEEVIGGNWKN